MALNCFGRRKKANKKPPPPPSVDDLDVRATDQHRQDRQYSVEFSGTPADPPPLPQRQNLEIGEDPNVVNSSPQSPTVPQRQTDDLNVSLTKAHRQSSSNVPTASQLSSDILSTPVPVGGHGASITKPAKSEHKPVERANSGDYLDPAIGSPLTPPPLGQAPTPTPTPNKLKASISEEKKIDIFNDYFQSETVRGLNVTVPITPSQNSGQPEHNYTNINQMEYPETFHSPGASKSESNLHSSGDHNLKSPRRPRPVPRVHMGSEKSMSSEDNEFAYENVQDTIRRLSDVTTTSESGSKTNTPRPLPRSRPGTDAKLSHDNRIQLPITPESKVNGGTISPLQQKSISKKGYIYDAASDDDYVHPDADPEAPSSNQSPTNHNRTLPKPKPTHAQNSAHLPAKGAVDLHAPIPKTGAEPGLISQAKKGYLPMDQSALTQAVSHNGRSRQPSGDQKSQILNRKIPVPTGNINDLHVPGYITVLSGSDGSPTKKAGEYYNISTKPDYLNVKAVPPRRKGSADNTVETNYFG